MKSQFLKITAIIFLAFAFTSCDKDTAEPEIKNKQEELPNLPLENFISSFEQVISGPYAWYWEFDHVYSGDNLISTEVNQALFGVFGQKSVLKYSHSFDSNGNIEYSTIEEGPILNDAKYYVYELNDEGFIENIMVKDAPEGRILYYWIYTYDESRRIISKNVDNRVFPSTSSNQDFIYNGNANITKWTIENVEINTFSEIFFDFNDQNQVTRILDSNGEETSLAYNSDGNLFEVSDINGSTNYKFHFDYSSENLTNSTFMNDVLRSTEIFGQDMEFRKSNAYRYEEDGSDFIIEGLPEDGSNQVVTENYFEQNGGEKVLKGSSRINWTSDQFNEPIRSEKNIYDSDGNFIFKYEREGTGGNWFDTNGDIVIDLATVPEWARNLAEFSSTYSNSIDFFNAKSYNTITHQ